MTLGFKTWLVKHELAFGNITFKTQQAFITLALPIQDENKSIISIWSFNSTFIYATHHYKSGNIAH